MGWQLFDTWIVVVGALSAMACALLGNFLILRRLSMMGDAISHTVLPGIVIAFMITGSRAGLPMFLGAVVVGVLTVFLVHLVNRHGDLEEGASMGVIFTALFALGLVLINSVHNVDLDPDCVLYGAVEFTPFDTQTLLGHEVPRAAISNGLMLLANLLFVGLFYKELKLSSFDPVFATTEGFNARLLHYLLMTLVAATVVAAFESVGSILVIAMLIVPGACAMLLTNRLLPMIGLSLFIAALCALLGHGAAVYTPTWFGVPSTSTAGLMGTAAGLLFVGVALFAPRHGVLSRAATQAMLSLRIAADDVLGMLYRRFESGAQGLTTREASAALQRGVLGRLAVLDLRRRGLVTGNGSGLQLSPAGEQAARELVRSHRLWEIYLVEKANVKPDHVHGTAERLEHITDREMRERLARVTNEPASDPHATRIPPE